MTTSQKLVKNTSYLTLAFIGQKLLAFVYFVIIARIIGVGNVGVYSVALAVTTIFSVFIDLGTSPVLTREIAKKVYSLQSFFSNIILSKVILSLVVYLAVIVTVHHLDYSAEIIRLVYISGIVMVLDSLVLTIYSMLRGIHNLRYEALGVIINQIIIISIGTIGLLFVSHDLMVLMVAFLVGSFVNLVYGLYIIKVKCNVHLVLSFNINVLKYVYSLSIPFAFAGIFTRVYSYIDTLLLKHYLGEASVGWYTTAYKIPFALQFIPTAFAASIYPAMSDLYKRQSDHISYVFEKSMFYLMLVAFPVTFGIYSIADELILRFYTDEYEPSIIVLKTMIFGVLFIFLNFPIGSLLSACDKQNVNTVFIGMTMVVNIIVNAVLIPKIGIVGAAYAFLISHGFLFFGTLIIAYKLIPINTVYLLKKALILLISSVLMLIAVAFIKESIGWILSMFCGAIIYIGEVLMFRILTIKEVVILIKKVFKR